MPTGPGKETSQLPAIVKAGTSAKSNSNLVSVSSKERTIRDKLSETKLPQDSVLTLQPALDESPSCHGNGGALILAKDYLSSFEPTNCDKEMWNDQFADANFFDSFNSQPGQGHGEFTTPATAEHYGTTAKYFQNHEVNSSLFQKTPPTQKTPAKLFQPPISVNSSFVAFETPVDQSLSNDASCGTGELFPPSQNQPSPLEWAMDPEAPTSFNSFSLENSNYLPREKTFPTTPSNTTGGLFPPSQNQPSPLETAIDPEAPTSFNSFSLENSNYLPREKTFPTTPSSTTGGLFPPSQNQPSPLETAIDPEAPTSFNSFGLENSNYLPREKTFPTTPSSTTGGLFPPSQNQPSPLETAIDPEAPTSFNSFGLENSNYLPREKTFPTTPSNTTGGLFPPPQNQPSPLVMAIDPVAPTSFNSFSLENSNYLHHGEDSSTTTYLQAGEDSSTTRSNTTAELFPPVQNQPSPLETAIDLEAPPSFNSFSLENSNYLPREKTFPTTPEAPPSSSMENSSYFHREETLPTTRSNTIGELFPPFQNRPSPLETVETAHRRSRCSDLLQQFLAVKF